MRHVIPLLTPLVQTPLGQLLPQAVLQVRLLQIQKQPLPAVEKTLTVLPGHSQQSYILMCSQAQTCLRVGHATPRDAVLDLAGAFAAKQKKRQVRQIDKA